MQYEYECQKCGQKQVKIVKLDEETTQEPCEKCGAKPGKLKRVFLTPHPTHGTWGRWHT